MIAAHLHRFRPLLRVGMTLLGPALLLYIIATADRRLLVDTLRTTNVWFVLAAVLLAVPFFVFKAIRWQLILCMWDLRLPHHVAVALVCIGQYIGTVTPGQTGDVLRAWYLRDRGYPLAVGLVSVALDRVCDLLITLVVAALSLVIYRGNLPQLRLSLVGGSIILLLFALAVGWTITSNRWGGAFLLSLTARLPSSLRHRLDTLAGTSISPQPGHLLLIMLTSVAALSWTYVRIYLLFLALGIPIPLGPLITFVALLALVGPVAPGGVGTRDALLVVVLQTTLGIEQGAASAQALAISILILLLNIVNVAIGFVYSLRYPLVSPTSEVPKQLHDVGSIPTG